MVICRCMPELVSSACMFIVLSLNFYRWLEDTHQDRSLDVSDDNQTWREFMQYLEAAAKVRLVVQNLRWISRKQASKANCNKVLVKIMCSQLSTLRCFWAGGCVHVNFTRFWLCCCMSAQRLSERNKSQVDLPWCFAKDTVQIGSVLQTFKVLHQFMKTRARLQKVIIWIRYDHHLPDYSSVECAQFLHWKELPVV